LSINQYGILSKLSCENGLILQELASRMVMDRSTLSHLIRPLERKGLVSIAVLNEDGRRKLVALTPVGHTSLKTAQPLGRRAEDRFQKILGNTNAAEMRVMLHRVCGAEL
jgi:DNA-binding MarR family transcriptional regulator